MDRTIARLQTLLAHLGYLAAPYAVGELDPATVAALQRFQQLHGLELSREPNDPTWERLTVAEQRDECAVVGQVMEGGAPIPRGTVIVRDRDLGDAASWPQLGAGAMGADGRFAVFYSMSDVLVGDRPVRPRTAVADLMFELRDADRAGDGFDVFRLPQDERVRDDEKALGIQARRVEDVRIVLRDGNGRRAEGSSEYERLLAGFRAVWPEVSPATLDDARREPAFVARELEVPPEQVDALVAAHRSSRQAFDGTVPEVVLYGLARCDGHYADLPRLALASSAELKEGIFQAVERGIIPAQSNEVIGQAVERILVVAPARALGAGAGATYGAVLGAAMPDEAQQVALLNAAAGREADPPSMWNVLRAHPAFAGDGAVERAQFALQLDALTNRHLPLMETLQRELGLTSMRALHELPPERLREIVRRPGVGTPEGTPGETPDARVEAYVTGLTGQLQLAFPTETVARVLGAAPPQLFASEAVRAAVATVLSRATSPGVHAVGEAFDIRTSHVDSYLAAHAATVLDGIAAEVRPAVADTLKRAQRLFRVSTGAQSFGWLMENGYASALQIAQIPQQTFLHQARGALGEPQALMIHNRATGTSNAALATFVQINDAMFGVFPAAVLGGADRIELSNAIGDAVARDFPSWSALFGEMAWCDCADCRTVYSPAAYLVDLLDFLDKSAKNADGQSPLDVLLARRPDIAALPLTCENTNTMLPYVDLVNEVLESLVVDRDPLKIPAFDTEGAATEELQAAPQHTNWNAYVTPAPAAGAERLDRAVYPPSLPFDAPLAAARTYWRHLEVSRDELMAAFTDGPLTNALAAERLGLSPNTFAVVTGQMLDETPTDLPTSVEDRYGLSMVIPALPPGGAGAVLRRLPNFLERTGLTFEELLGVLRMRFVNPETNTLEIVRRLQLPGADLLAYAQAGFVNPSAALVAALQKAGVAPADFAAWAGAHLAGDAMTRLRRTILADAPPDRPDDLDATTLRHWDAAAPELADAEWRKLDRLVRLWRALGWTIDDLDLALTSLGATEITAAVVRQLSQIDRLRRTLDIPIPQVVSLWADLDPTRAGSVYEQRFRNRALLRMDPALEPDWAGRVHPAAIGDHLPALQAGLHCSAGDLTALRAHLHLTDDAAPLSLAVLSALFRHVTLAKALRLNVRDLTRMLGLTALDPFVPPGDQWPALELVAAVRDLRESGLNAAQLAYLLSDVSVLAEDEARQRTLDALKAGLRAVRAELDPAAETDGSLARRALTLLNVDPARADAALQVVLGTDRTTVLLVQPPAAPPAIPFEWTERLRYTAGPDAPSLSVLGALTDDELPTVRGFSADPAYQAAVTGLHLAPRKILQDLAATLAAAGVPFPGADLLLADTLPVADAALREGVVRARLKRILDDVLPPLRDRLGRTLVKQTLTTVLPDAATLAFLLEGKRATGAWALPASAAGKPLIDDFLALATSDDTTAAAQGYELLRRIRLLEDGVGLQADDLRVLATHVVAFRAGGNHLCTYEDWKAIAAYGRVRARPGQAPGALARLWDAPTPNAAVAVLADLLAWPPELLTELTAPTSLALGVHDLQQPATLERLILAGDLVQRLGVSATQAAAWARHPVTQAVADEARRAVKAKYDERAWLEVAKTLSDTLREARRAALVAYLQPRLGVHDTNGLYARLLIDVEMSPCMQTSRIKQAISSVQLFIQRCLLNLEHAAVAPTVIDPQHWKWMQNYRVWEANRKVLLYPENWILPELRDDKTPFFKELEAELLQDEVTGASVERALVGYLEKLDRVARLEILAMHVQDDFGPDEKLQTVVHLVGRTPNPPYAYHYRRYVVTAHGTSLWTPWEVVPLDLQGTVATLVSFNRRLYLFWTVAATKAAEPKPDSPPSSRRDYYQEIKLAWSEYRNGAWGPKHVTDTEEMLSAGYVPGGVGVETAQGLRRPDAVVERLEARVDADRLRVLCIRSRAIGSYDTHTGQLSGSAPLPGTGTTGEPAANAAQTNWFASFVLDGCHGRLVKDETDTVVTSRSGFVLRMSDKRLKAKQLTAFAARPSVTVFDSTTAPVQLAEDSWVHGDHGYLVFADATRSYFGELTSRTLSAQELVAQPDQVYPAYVAIPAPSLAARRASTLKAGNQSKPELQRNSWATASATLAAAVATPQPTSVRPAGGDPVIPMDPASVVAEMVQTIGAQLDDHPMGVTLRFEPLFHPFACTYMKGLQQYGISGLMNTTNQQLTLAPTFAVHYRPNAAAVAAPYPDGEVDFGATGNPGVYRASPYAVYNWELFFHAPMLIADRLSQNQRFEEAMRWLHYVFDATDPRGGYWKFRPFQTAPRETIEQWLQRLGAGDPDVQRQIAEWKDHPFQPHLLARMRLPAYQKYVVQVTLDTLIAWGDKLFASDTLESINTATQLYVMAAEHLGPRPQPMPARGEPRPMTFAGMRGKLDALSNTVAQFENVVPFVSSATMAPAADTVGLLGVSRTLYFRIPPNGKLLAYWDTVADRLFKVRNCMNLAGVVRQLPLFEPPIDPALLVRAAAQGLDIGSVLGELSAPLPAYRFAPMLQKALDACADLRSLGERLLSTLEKKDAEQLAQLRASHETALRRAMLEIRRQQEEEAAEQVEALTRSRAVPVEKLLNSRRLMGIEMQAPKVGEEVAIVRDSAPIAAEGGVFLLREEQQELDSSHSASLLQAQAAAADTLANLMHYLPSQAVVAAPQGSGTRTKLPVGGDSLGPAMTATAKALAGLAGQLSHESAHAGKMAGHKRKHQEYAIAANVAAREIMQVDKQLTAAQIRANVARRERELLELEIAQAESVEEHLRSKYTNLDLYGWMQGQIAALYFRCYQLTYELAKGAERSFRFQLGLRDSRIIEFGAWDSLRKGLLAGERLQLQLRQLERAYHDQHRRELEITRHVSLLQLAPMALIRLKETGRCEVDLPELLYDMDYPGHYMRRIRSVAMSIPAVVGPYTSVNATLTLLKSETRIRSDAGRDYARDVEHDDDRFLDDFTAIQAIATSGAQHDSGLFEVDFRDERYLPFEGAGAACRWRIELDPDCNRFDLETVTDVVLHVKYTARDGGQRLREKAKARWKRLVADQESHPLARLFSMKHDFPTEWHRLRTQADANGEHAQTIALPRDRFPWLFQRSELSIGRIDLLGVPLAGANPTKLPSLRGPAAADQPIELLPGAPLKSLLHQTADVAVRVDDTAATAGWRLSVLRDDVAASIGQLDDLLLVCQYSVRAQGG